jgi:hypothetical protein
MSTRNFDSSLLTQRRQAKALGAFATVVAAGNAAGTSLLRTQPTDQRAVIVIEQNLGKCYCATDALANPYAFNPSGGPCGCGGIK